MTPSAALPTAVLALVLKRTTLQERLATCARVSTAWKAAAYAATTSISLKKQYVSKSLGKWLQNDGSSVESLQLEVDEYAVKQVHTESHGRRHSNLRRRSDANSDSDDVSISTSSASSGDGTAEADEALHQQSLAAMRMPPPEFESETDSDVDGDAPSRLQLPCSSLQHLTSLCVIASGDVPVELDFIPQLHTQKHSSSHDSAVAADASGRGNAVGSSSSPILPRLVDLKLVQCKLADEAAMQQLFSTVAPELTQLYVEQLWWEAGVPRTATSPQWLDRDGYAVLLSLACAVQSCSKLRSLHLLEQPGHPPFARHHGRLSAARDLPSPLADLSSLVRLQELVLFWPEAAPDTYLPHLPTSLASLQLTAPWGWQGSGYGTAPLLLQQLPKLQHLHALVLDSCKVSDAVLCGMTQLRALHLQSTTIAAASLAKLSRLQWLTLQKCTVKASAAAAGRAEAAAAAAAAAMSALSAIGHLTQLKVLDVVKLTYQQQSPIYSATPPSDFGALTASSQLQRMRVDGYNGGALPRGAVEHMFPEGRQLQQLTYLDIAHSDFKFDANSWRLTGRDLRRIAAACSGLQSFSIQGLLQPGARTDALTRLTDCRSLSVGGRAFDNAAAARIARMTQLTSLSWWCSRGFDSRGVERLTALANLRELTFVPIMPNVSDSLWQRRVYDSDDEGEVPDFDLRPASEMEPDLLAMLRLRSTESRRVVLTCQQEEALPVWRQLDGLCDCARSAAARLQQLKADNKQLQQKIEQQQDTISQLLQRIDQLQCVQQAC